MPRTALMVLLILLVVMMCGGATGQNVAPAKTAQLVALPDEIKLTLEPSRGQIASDTSFALNALIENTSAHPIFLSPTSLTLTIPPEVDPAPDVAPGSQWYATLPATGGEDKTGSVLALQPGSRTLAVFSMQKNPKWWQRLATSIRLVPGDYSVHAVCAYWNTAKDAEAGAANYSMLVAEQKVPFVSPPLAVFCGAALGGLLAFLLLPSLWLPVTKEFKDHKSIAKVGIFLRGLLVSSLLSIVITILLSRVSESQFLVRVSVEDFIGAVAIGFIAGASGTGVLQRFNVWQEQKRSNLREGPAERPEFTPRKAA